MARNQILFTPGLSPLWPDARVALLIVNPGCQSLAVVTDAQMT